MLLYDWKKIFTATQGNPTEIVRILKMLVEKKVPKNKYDKIYYYSQLNFSGESFLLHPEPMLYYGYKYTHREMAIYTALASLRPLADYTAYSKITLDLLHAPEDVIDYIYDNRLLEIEDGEIHFLYERSPLTDTEIH